MMTGCKKLDRSRSYGEIMGATDGSKYEQDGKVFNIHGNLLNAGAIEVTTEAEVVNDNEDVRIKLKPGRKPKEFYHGS